MAFWILILVGLAALGALAIYVLREQSIERDQIDRQLHDPDTPTLEYVVPTGQDPATILAALERAGYTASVDPHHTHQHVLVGCPGGIAEQRTRVRGLLATATVSAPGSLTRLAEVRFVDEL
jgi:hypothetical protein